MKSPLYKTAYVLFLFCQTVFAETIDFDKELADELKYLKAEFVTIGSRMPRTKDDTPAILTIVSEKEILNSGARDLMDVLRLVPGFDFGIDMSNAVGPSIRGNFAYEGGILVLIDGLEMNERAFGTVQLGQNYPIDNIQRIEVMRSPGSIIYGGFARLGVVNIITKGAMNKATELDGDKKPDEFAITTRYGQTGKIYGHRGVSFYAGKNLSNDARITVSGKAVQAHRSDRVYTTVLGDSVNLANTNKLENMLFNIGFQYTKDLSMRFILDEYNIESSDSQSIFLPTRPSFITFKSALFNIKYAHDFSDAIKLSFNFNYSHQTPWTTTDFTSAGYVDNYKLSATRYSAGARLDYAVNEAIHITSGLDYTYEAFKKLTQYDTLTPNNLPNYNNIAPYIEGLIKTDWGNLTLGLRYDKHNTYESILSPRVAFTNTLGDFHYKLLYSQSFRTPNIGNYVFNLARDIKPERTKAYEIELGYQLTQNLSLTTNAFFLSTKGKFVYGVVNNQAMQYNAYDKIKTAGVETELRWKEQWGYLTFNHSYSQMINNADTFKPIAQASNTVVDSDKALAFPAHKFTLNAHYEITRSFSVNPSLILTTSRYGYNAMDAQGNLELHKYSPEILGNLYFRYQDALFKGFDVGIGVYNLFNIQQNYIQPYNYGHAPLPGQSREFIFKLSYQL